MSVEEQPSKDNQTLATYSSAGQTGTSLAPTRTKGEVQISSVDANTPAHASPPPTFLQSIHQEPNSVREAARAFSSRGSRASPRYEGQVSADEDKYRALCKAMDEGFCVIEVLLDENGRASDYRFLEANPAFERQTGLQEVVGKRVRELIPTLEEHWFQLYGRIVLTGQPERFESPVAALGRWYNVSAWRHGAPENRQVAMLFRGETEHRQTVETLRLALNAAHLGTCDWTYPDGEMRWNERRFHMFGLPAQPNGTVRTEDFYASIHPEDLAQAKQAIHRGVESSSGEHAEEYRVVWPDGTVRWIAETGRVAARREDGSPVRVISVLLDITERRASEATLRASEEKYRLIVDSARTNAIFTLDTAARITSWNPGAESIFGWLAADIVGQEFDVLIPLEFRGTGSAQRDADQAVREGRCQCSEWFVRCDGSRFWGDGSLSPMFTHGKVTGFLKIMRDTTEEFQAREAREYVQRERARLLEVAQSARQTAEEANAAKDRFLAVLSHELRTPLMPINLALATLAKRSDLPAAVHQVHDMIRRNVELEARFIDDLLDVTRIVRGKMEIVRTDIDLHEAIQRAVEVSLADFEAKHQRLTVALEATEHRCPGDFARLQQVFWNLLKNASKFTPLEGSIRVRTHNLDGTLVVEITDTGIGLEAGAIGRIFDPFEQADGTIMRRYGGLGLGLAIAKATVEAHQGVLSASSPGQGQGTTLMVAIPLDDQPSKIQDRD